MKSLIGQQAHFLRIVVQEFPRNFVNFCEPLKRLLRASKRPLQAGTRTAGDNPI